MHDQIITDRDLHVSFKITSVRRNFKNAPFRTSLCMYHQLSWWRRCCELFTLLKFSSSTKRELCSLHEQQRLLPIDLKPSHYFFETPNKATHQKQHTNPKSISSYKSHVRKHYSKYKNVQQLHHHQHQTKSFHRYHHARNQKPVIVVISPPVQKA